MDGTATENSPARLYEAPPMVTAIYTIKIKDPSLSIAADCSRSRFLMPWAD